MGSESNLPTVAEVAAFIERSAPGARERIEASGPDLSDLLTIGQLGGAEIEGDKARRPELERRATVIRLSLSEALAVAGHQRDRVLGRVKIVRITRVVVAAITSLTAGGTLAALLGQAPGARVLAAISFISSVASVFADKILLGGIGSLEEVTRLLEQVSASTRSLNITASLLSPESRPDLGDESLSNVIAEANGSFGEINQVLAKLETI